MVSPSSRANTLPAIGDHITTGMSIEDEYRFGNIIAGSIHQQVSLWQDLAALSFLQDISQPMISHSQLANKQLRLFIVRDNHINAFAAPGGIIGINTGLIQQATSVDELAAVIAHEVGHLSLRHYAQTQAQEKTQTPLVLGAFLASIWIATNIDSDIGEAGLYATQSALQRSQLSYSRVHERQADRIGFELMRQSPFNVTHMQRLLARLQSPYTSNAAAWEWARSHPVTNERVADISQRAMTINSGLTENGFDLSFELLRIYQRINLASTPLPSIADLVMGIDELSANYTLLLDYATALTNQRLGASELAVAQLESIHHQQPQAQLIWYSWMNALLASRKHDQLFEQLRLRKLQRHEDQLSLWLTAQTLYSNQQTTAAISSLWRTLDQQPNWVFGWRTLGEWSAQAHRQQLHHAAKSHWHLLRGESELALQQAEYGLLQTPDPLIKDMQSYKQQAQQLYQDQLEFN
jgi:predicted Zn-dependent protease